MTSMDPSPEEDPPTTTTHPEGQTAIKDPRHQVQQPVHVEVCVQADKVLTSHQEDSPVTLAINLLNHDDSMAILATVSQCQNDSPAPWRCFPQLLLSMTVPRSCHKLHPEHHYLVPAPILQPVVQSIYADNLPPPLQVIPDISEPSAPSVSFF